MLKYLAIFAVLLGLAVYVAAKDKQAAQDAAQKAAHQNSTVLSTKSNEDHTQEYIEDAERNLPSWYGFFRWPYGTTAWAIILTLFAIAEQTKHTAEAADATRQSVGAIRQQTTLLADSVAAAQKSADAFVNSQRARLAVIFTEQQPSVFRFHAKNSGKSPALIMFFTVRFRVLESGQTLPLRPDYLDEEEDWSGEEEWVLPDKMANLEINGALERLDLSETSLQFSADERHALKTDKSRAYFYGYVRYRETVSREDKFTRFRYACFYTGEGYFLLRDRPGPYSLET